MNIDTNKAIAKKQTPLIIIVIIESVIVIGLLLCFLIPQIRCQQALSTNNTLFNLDSADVESVRFVDSFFNSDGYIEMEEAKENFVKQLNDFTYVSAEPVYFSNPDYTYYYVEVTVNGEVKKYPFTINEIIVDNVKYITDINDHYFSGWTSMALNSMYEQ